MDDLFWRNGNGGKSKSFIEWSYGRLVFLSLRLVMGAARHRQLAKKEDEQTPLPPFNFFQS